MTDAQKATLRNLTAIFETAGSAYKRSINNAGNNLVVIYTHPAQIHLIIFPSGHISIEEVYGD